MKTILSDAKSCEKHDETKYTTDGGVMDDFVHGCRQNHGKGVKIKVSTVFWTIVKKATFLARFIY